VSSSIENLQRAWADLIDAIAIGLGLDRLVAWLAKVLP
jgi:hypothetical protein